MIFLHESDVEVHGNLKSSNCVITSRWVLQLTDFGLAELQHAASLGSYDPTGIHTYYQNLLWKAPELLREKGPVPNMSQKGDAYAFAIILYEIYGRKGPYGPCDAGPKGFNSFTFHYSLSIFNVLLEPFVVLMYFVFVFLSFCYFHSPLLTHLLCR